jgi:hypothetical protein
MSPSVREEAKRFAEAERMHFVEVSAKSNANLEKLREVMDSLAVLPSNSVRSYRREKAEEAIRELERIFEHHHAFCGVTVTRDVLTLLIIAVKKTESDQEWGDPYYDLNKMPPKQQSWFSFCNIS